MDSSKKVFRKSGDEIVDIVPGLGGCIATDMITVDGQNVGFMYREEPDNDFDSGWRFMSGYESDEYMDHASNHGVYDVNTIANYDPDIVPFIDSPAESAFERGEGRGAFVAVEFDAPDA